MAKNQWLLPGPVAVAVITKRREFLEMYRKQIASGAAVMTREEAEGLIGLMAETLDDFEKQQAREAQVEQMLHDLEAQAVGLPGKTRRIRDALMGRDDSEEE